jgi:purine-binding chemotaxis protein CheW
MQLVKDFFCFSVDQYRFALPLNQVIRVIQAVELQQVPDSPSSLLGLVDYHGTILPVMNFRLHIGVNNDEISPDQFMLLAQTTKRKFFLIVDEVHGVSESSEQAVTTGTELSVDLSAYGIFRRKDGLFFIFDLELFLSTEDHANLDRILNERMERQIL